jgi:ribosomal protein L16 Arg81 hydroxylase
MSIATERGDVNVVPEEFPTLSRVIGPVLPATFWQRHHEREPLLVSRDEPGRYADLLTLDGLDEALSLSGTGMEHVRLVMDGRETPVSELIASRGTNGSANALETLYEHYRDGNTVIVNALEGRWAPLRRFARALGTELDARVQINIYLTPPGARGFKPHYDMHDVFIAQIHGSKKWQLAGMAAELPLQDNPYDKRLPEPEPLREFDLRPGDTLYLPRGTVHSGSANETASLHLTIGIHPVLWSQLFNRAVQRVFAEDVRFRRALPVGFARDGHVREAVETICDELREALLRQLSPSTMIDTAVDRMTAINAPALRGHLVDLDELPQLTLDTPLRRRPDIAWRLSVADGVAELSFHNKAVRFPADVVDEVRFVAEHGVRWFEANDIPGDLDAAGRRTLVHTLLHEGFLTFR